MDFKGADILSLQHFTRPDIEQVLEMAAKLEKEIKEKRKLDYLRGCVLAALFYEPSTRTRMSFETAMHRMGGDVISAVGMDYSSLVKGETLADTAKIVANYADVIVLRHPQEGSAHDMAEAVETPVINAGDGPGQHPTQALLDLYTMQKERGKLDGLRIMMVGDLRYGRTVHSLIEPLSHFDVSMVFVSPDELKMPESYLERLREKGISFVETANMEEKLADVDVLYMTRIQQERFATKEEYEKFRGVYVLTRELMERLNPALTVMHPLPRVWEISADVDTMPGAAYFRQAENGLFVRMALLGMVLGRV